MKGKFVSLVAGEETKDHRHINIFSFLPPRRFLFATLLSVLYIQRAEHWLEDTTHSANSMDTSLSVTSRLSLRIIIVYHLDSYHCFPFLC